MKKNVKEFQGSEDKPMTNITVKKEIEKDVHVIKQRSDEQKSMKNQVF